MTVNLCVMLQLCAVFIESRFDMRVKYALMVITMITHSQTLMAMTL